METITILSIGVGASYVIFNLFYSLIDRFNWFDRKPFNCKFCLSLWCTLILFSLTLDVHCILIPIINEYLTKK